MTRALLLTCLALTGCYDFVGDRGHLGFSTDLVVDGVLPWTPERPVALGSVFTVAVTEDLQDPETEPEGYTAHTAAGLHLIEGDGERVEVAADGPGTAWFTGPKHDGFSVRTGAAARAILAAPLVEAPALDALAIVVGARVPLALGLRDASDRPLGYPAQQWTLSVDGGSATRLEDAPGVWWVRADRAGPLAVSAEGPSEVVDGPELVGVERTDVTEVELVAIEDGASLLLVPVGWTDDELPVLGLRPAWAWDGDLDVMDGMVRIDPDDPPEWVEARWDGEAVPWSGGYAPEL